jgi:hypothetical protein
MATARRSGHPSTPRRYRDRRGDKVDALDPSGIPIHSSPRLSLSFSTFPPQIPFAEQHHRHGRACSRGHRALRAASPCPYASPQTASSTGATRWRRGALQHRNAVVVLLRPPRLRHPDPSSALLSPRRATRVLPGEHRILPLSFPLAFVPVDASPSRLKRVVARYRGPVPALASLCVS